MSKYLVRLPVYCTALVEVEADSEKEAIRKGADSFPHGLCHHCANRYEIGDSDLSSEISAEEITS